MADELANVLAYLRTLSPSENPYIAFGDWLQQRALPRIAPSFATMSVSTSASWPVVRARVAERPDLAVLALSVATLLIKLCQPGSLWLFQPRDTASGRLIVPKTSLFYLIVVIAYLTDSIAFAQLIYETYFGPPASAMTG